MGTLIAMAWRNVRRNTRRSLLAVISVAISVTFIVFAQGLIGGFLSSMVKNYTKNETGHVRIITQEFKDRIRFMPVTENLQNSAPLVEKVKAIPELEDELKMITERVTFGVLLSNNGNNKSALAVAGDPETEKNLMMFQHSLLEGSRYIENEREVIMGKDLAAALKYKVGDTVKVMARGADYALHMRKFTLVGIFDAGINTVNRKFFQMPIADAKKLLRMGDSTQQIVIMLNDYEKAQEAAALIRDKLEDPSVAVISWADTGEVFKMFKVASTAYNFIYLAIALLGAFIIGNIMMMVVMERRREIGIIRSMGFPKRQVLLLFTAEGTMLGVIGSGVGVLLGLALNTYFHYKGLDFSSMLDVGEFPLDNVAYATINLYILIKAFVIGVLISALVSILPSRQAAKLQVVDAIRAS